MRRRDMAASCDKEILDAIVEEIKSNLKKNLFVTYRGKEIKDESDLVYVTLKNNESCQRDYVYNETNDTILGTDYQIINEWAYLYNGKRND